MTGEGFSGGDADLGSDVDVGSGIGFAGNRRSDDVADAIDHRASLFGHFDGGEGVGGFARLGYGDDDVVGRQDRVAVTEFAGVFDFDWDTGYFLY